MFLYFCNILFLFLGFFYTVYDWNSLAHNHGAFHISAAGGRHRTAERWKSVNESVISYFLASPLKTPCCVFTVHTRMREDKGHSTANSSETLNFGLFFPPAKMKKLKSQKLKVPHIKCTNTGKILKLKGHRFR